MTKLSPELSCGRGQLSSQVGSSPLSVSEKFLSAFLVGSSHVTHLFNHQIYNHSDRVKLYSQETKGRLFEMIFRTILKNLWSIKFIKIDLIWRDTIPNVWKSLPAHNYLSILSCFGWSSLPKYIKSPCQTQWDRHGQGCFPVCPPSWSRPWKKTVLKASQPIKYDKDVKGYFWQNMVVAFLKRWHWDKKNIADIFDIPVLPKTPSGVTFSAELCWIFHLVLSHNLSFNIYSIQFEIQKSHQNYSTDIFCWKILCFEFLCSEILYLL